jgi:RecA/RadA recombinase
MTDEKPEEDPFGEDFDNDEFENEDDATAQTEPEPEPDSDSGKKNKKTTKKKSTSSKSKEPEDEANMSAPRPTISLDQRKLTKKQKGQLDKWNGKNAMGTVDKFFGAQIKKARTRFGADAVYSGTALDNLVIGIPIPSLAFEYVITQDCFPLGLIFHLCGPPGSLKSALYFEMSRWFMNCGGGSVLQEVETKLSPDFPKSIIGADAENTLVVNRCDSVEDWQQKLQHWVAQLKKDFTGTKADPGPGRTVPVLFGVDTIMGKASYETQEKIRGDGYAGRAFPVEALSINNFLKTFPQDIDQWPFAVVLSNHLKEAQDAQGNKVRSTSGGKAVNFQESFELETRVRKSKIQCSDWEGRVISLKCYKNSFGPTGREAWTRVLWWDEYNEEKNEYEQKTIWDWGWATTRLLSTVKGMEAARLKDMNFHIATPKVSDVENKAWSKTLGMKESDAVSWTEMGEMIHRDEDLMRKLRVALGIKRRPLLAGDYLEQLQEISKDQVE